MKTRKFILLAIAYATSVCTFAQWNNTANNSTTGNLTVGGKIGIGTTNPQTALDVSGTLRSKIINVYGTQGYAQIDSSGAVMQNSYPIVFKNNGNTKSAIRGIGGFGNSTAIQFLTIEPNGTAASRMYINTDGKIGIGNNTNPQALLDVSGTLRSKIINVYGTQGYAQIDSSGAVMQNSYPIVFKNNGNTKSAIRGIGGFGNSTAIQFLTIEPNGTAASRMYINTDGKIGIGNNTNPQALLDVSGTLRSKIINVYGTQGYAQIDSSGAVMQNSYPIVFKNNGNTKSAIRGIGGFGNSTAIQFLTIEPNGTAASRMYINTDGKIGIGNNTNPQALLDVSGTLRSKIINVYGTQGYAQIDSSGAVMQNSYPIVFKNNGNTKSAIRGIGGFGNSTAIQFLTIEPNGTAASRMYINTDGKISIGNNTNPQALLDVSGTLRSKIINVYGTQGYAQIDSAGAVLKDGYPLLFNSGSAKAAIRGIGYAGALTHIQFQTITSGGVVTPRMHINSDGKIGVGTTNPQALLDVSGTLRSKIINVYGTQGYAQIDSAGAVLKDGYPLLFNSGSAKAAIRGIGYAGALTHIQFQTITSGGVVTPRMHINSDGKIGVGTTNPQALLDVSGTLRSKIINVYGTQGYAQIDSAGAVLKDGYPLLFNSGSAKAAIRGIGYAGALTHIQFQTITSGGVVTPRMHINSDGKIGIGTTNPQTLLDVRGTIQANDIKVVVAQGADFVFDAGYKLRSLSEVEAFVKENKRLPEIQAEKDMQQNGVSVNDLQIKLLQKVEELTLYVIQQNKRIEELEQALEKK